MSNVIYAEKYISEGIAEFFPIANVDSELLLLFLPNLNISMYSN